MISTLSPATISAEGRHARDRGDPVTANPYPVGSDEFRTWERGYRMVDEEASAAVEAVHAELKS